MSKNNVEEISKYVFNQSQHYALRKLSVGVASVLLGTTVMMVNTACADQITSTPQAVETSEVQNGSSALSGVNGQSSNSQSSNRNEINNEVQQNNQNVLVANSSTGSQDQDQQSLSTNNNAINTLGMSADSQNQRFAGLQQSLVQQDSNNENDDIVQNVHVSLINGYTELTHQPGYPWTAGSNTSFDLNLDKMSVNQSVVLGHIHQDSDTGHYMSVAMPATRQWVMYHSQYIGYVTYQDSGWLSVPDMPYTFVLTNKPVDVSGLVHLSVNVPSAFYINQDHPDHFRGIPLSHNVVSFVNNDGKVTSSIKYTIQQNDNFTRYDQESLSGIKSVLNSESYNHFSLVNVSGNGQANMVITFTFPELNLDDVANTLYGNNLTTPISLLNKDYLVAGRVRLKNGGTVLTRSSDVTAKAGDGTYGITGAMSMGVDSNGRYVDSWGATAGHGYYDSDALLSDVIGPVGLSLQQMRSRIDLSKNVIMISQQKDGSLLYVANFTPSFFNTNPSASELSWTINGYKQLNADSNPDKAYNNSLHAMNDIFHNRLTQLAIWQPISIADPTVSDTLIVDTLDPDTGAIISTNKSGFTPNTYASKDQSTVKLHVISSVGAALQQVKSFTDWPDQNKHASLTIPSITGYHLVTNPESILSSLHLSGTAISSSTSASYPAENTVADYYVVMAPDTESVKVNIVDSDEGTTLNSYTLSGDYGSVIMPTSDLSTRLESLLSSGKYDLVTNPLTDSLKYLTTNSPITISLKHRLDSTQCHYRIIEDLPDGTKKVIIDMEATLYKDANTDKWQPDVAYLDGDFTKKVLMSDIYKLNVGQQADDGLPDFLKADIDKVSGYAWNLVDGTAGYQDGLFVGFYNSDEKNAGEIYMDLFNGSAKAPNVVNNVASILPSRDFHIIYTRRSYPVTVNYYDLSGALISSAKSQHLFADSVDVAPSVPANYVFAPGQSTHLTVSYNSSDNELDLVVIPRATVFTDSRTVTRTIQITRPNGTVQSVVQSVQFARPAYFNVVTNSIQYGSWSSPVRYFTQYIPSSISDYVSPTVASQQITPASQSLVVRVSYTPIKLIQIPSYIDAAGHTYTSLPAGYHVVVGQSASSVHASVLIAPDAVSIVPVSLQYVTRTVTITLPNGRKRVIHQRVRKGTRFGRVAVPKLRGYKVVVTGDSQELGPTSADRDMNMSVKFVKM